MTGGLKAFKLILYLHFFQWEVFMYQNCVSKSDKCQLKVTNIYSEKKLSFKQHHMVIMLSPRSVTFNAVQKIKEKPMLSFLESREQYRKSQAIG